MPTTRSQSQGATARKQKQQSTQKPKQKAKKTKTDATPQQPQSDDAEEQPKATKQEANTKKQQTDDKEPTLQQPQNDEAKVPTLQQPQKPQKKNAKKRKQKAWPPPAGAFPLSHFQPPSIPDFDLGQQLEFLSEDDPAVFIDYAPDANIHTACGLAGSPVAQAANPAATAAQLRLWVRTQFTNISPNCSVMLGPPPGVPSTSVFHRLSNTEFGHFVNSGAGFYPWMYAMYTAGASLGRMYWVTPVPGGGGGGGRSPQAQHFRGWNPFQP